MNTAKCKARRMNDEMQCVCGLTWGIDEEPPECRPDKTGDTRQECLNEIYDMLGDDDVIQ